jgi:predicted amidohydrolase
MRESLTVAVAQPSTVAHDVAGNALAHAAAVRAADARVVVFPELSITGYELDATPVAPDDPRLAPIVEACARTGSLALVGAPVPGAHIAMLAVSGAGSTLAYRKMWLGDEEREWFVAGPSPSVIEVDGWRLGLAICKDTGVARHAADTVALGIDAYLAGTVKMVDETRLQDDRAHRIATEHGVWVAVASFAGSTGSGYDPAAGRSSIRAPDGTVVARAGFDPGDVARATITD